MDSPGSVTRAVSQLRSPDPAVRAEAARLIWARYLDRLLGLARGHMARSLRRREDEDDVVQSVFRSFCRRQGRGDFDLQGRDALWALLVTITLRKTRKTAARHGCASRDRRREPGASSEDADWALEQMEASGPSPAEAAALAEGLELRLRSLGDPTLRRVALARMEGRTVEEIAVELGCVARSVERKLERIRSRWCRGEEAGRLRGESVEGEG